MNSNITIWLWSYSSITSPPFLQMFVIPPAPPPPSPSFLPEVSPHITNRNHHSKLWFMPSFDEYLLSTYHVLDPGDTEMKMIWYLL